MSKPYKQPPSKPVVVKPSESAPQITQADLELLMGITVPLAPVEPPPEEIEEVEEPEAAEPEEPAESEEIMAKEPATAPFKLEPPPVMSMVESEPVLPSTTVVTELQIALPLAPLGSQATVAARIVLPPKPLVMAGSDRDQCQRELRQMDQAVEMFVAFARRIDCPAFLAKGRELEAFVDGCRLDWEQGTDFRKRGL